MAANDTVLVRKVYTEDGKTTNGVAETVSLQDFVALLPSAGTSLAGTQVMVTRQTAPAAAPAAFADLTAAATAYNAMRTALIAAGVFI